MAPYIGGPLPFVVVALLVVLLRANGEDTSQTFQPDISVIQTGATVISQKNGKLMLNCSVTKGEKTLLNYTWFKDDQPVAEVNPKIRVFQNGSLYIKKFRKRKRKTDEGVYTCIARDNVGSVIAQHVRVQVASVDRNFLRQPQAQGAYVGGSARFECAIKAFPSAMFRWQKNHVLLPQDENKYTHLSSGVLHIHNLQLEDTGLYRCITSYGDLHKLQNIVDSDIWRKSVEANLTVSPGIGRREALIIPGNTNVTVTTGETAVLECLVDGSPMPNVTWSRLDMKPLDSVTYIGNKNLKIKNVEKHHAGVYVCTAKSLDFQPVKLHSILTVNSAPVIKTAPDSQSWPRARTVIFRCEVEASPAPTVTWYRNGKKIEEVQPFEFKDNSLVIYNVEMEHAGYYQCVAENSIGWTNVLAELRIWEKDGSPKPPSGLKAMAVSDTKIFVQWNKSFSEKDLPIITYVVTIMPADGSEGLDTKFVRGNEDILNITIAELKPFMKYVVYVKAFNKKGASPKSEEVIVQTMESVPIKAPDITLSLTGTNQIRVEWEKMEPSESRGVISQYKVYYKKQSLQPSGEHVTTVNGSKAFYIIKGVEPNQDYEVRVLASTKKGYPTLNASEWPWVLIRTAKKPVNFPVPRLSVNRLNATTVKISWDVSDHASKVISYDIVLRNLHTKSIMQSFTVAPPETDHIFTNLENGTHYEVTLEAKGTEETSGPVAEEFHMIGNTPTLPAVSLKGTTLNSNTILLTWSQPEQPHKIKFYEICYSLESSNKKKCVSSLTSSMKLSDLEPFTSYSFEVRTHFMNQEIQSSRPLIARTHDDLPSAPTNITYIVVSPGTVELHWKPPASPNGVITSYIIFYNNNEEVPDTMWRNLTQTGEFTRATVQELTAASYYFKLRACTRAGQGHPSPIVIVYPMRQCNPQLQQDMCDTTTAPLGHGKPPSPQLGIIVGVTIGIVCILICIIVIVFRNRCFKTRDEPPRCLHGNGHIPGYGNGHAFNVMPPNRLSSSVPSTDIDAMTPMLTMPENAESDSKGGGTLIVTPNGVRINGLSQSFQNGHVPNGHVTRLEGSTHLNDSGSSEEHRGLIAAMLAASTDCSTGLEGSELSALTGASLEEIDGSLEEESHMRGQAVHIANGEAAMLNVTQLDGGQTQESPQSPPGGAAALTSPSLRNIGSCGSPADSSTSSSLPRSNVASRRDKGQGHVDRPPTPPPPLPSSIPGSSVCSTQESPVAPGRHVDTVSQREDLGQLPQLYVSDGTWAGHQEPNSVV